jgi:uncharacterized protein (TIGR02246 family)
MAGASTVGPETEAVRKVAHLWTAAVASADINELARLMTDDIVVIHGNGRMSVGRDAVVADLSRSFQDFQVEQKVDFEETVVAGDWAFDRAKVHTTITRRKGGDRKNLESRAMTILRRSDQGDWRVARVIGVIVQSPQS